MEMFMFLRIQGIVARLSDFPSTMMEGILQVVNHDIGVQVFVSAPAAHQIIFHPLTAHMSVLHEKHIFTLLSSIFPDHW